MAAESGYVQLLGAFWEWAQKDTGLWLRVIGSLRDVLAERDLETDETLMVSLRLSAFSILIAIVMDVSAEALFTHHPFSPTYGLLLIVVYYIWTLVCAVALKLASILVLSAQAMRKCLVMALFMTAYWPLNNLGQFILYDDKSLTVNIFGPGSGGSFGFFRFDSIVLLLFIAALGVFLFAKTLSAVRYVFHVGFIRAVMAVVGVLIITGFFTLVPMRPLYQAMTRQLFGA